MCHNAASDTYFRGCYCGFAIFGETLCPDHQRRQRHQWLLGTDQSVQDNSVDYFGVSDIRLPDRYQVEQAHTLQRHANRFPTGFYDDGINDQNFADKLAKFTKANPSAKLSGDLMFLNTYIYIMTSKGLLTGLGASTEFMAGVSLWTRYGRTLYDATVGQSAYNASYANVTARA